MDTEASRRLLHRYTLFVAACTFVLVCWGATVTSLGAGLAVPDWPLTYGHFIAIPLDWLRIPNILAEHGHRVLAGTVGILTIILAVLYSRLEARKWTRIVAYGALSAVIAQALLGGMTVRLLDFRPQVSVVHAAFGQSFFCLVTSLVIFTSQGWRTKSPSLTDPPGVGTSALCLILTASVFFQLILGAFMRHTASGLAIYDFPLSYGHLIPPTDDTSIHNFNIDRDAIGLPKVAAWQILLHFSHRLWALAVCAVFCAVAFRVMKYHRDSGEMLFPVLAILFLLLLQICLGALTIFTGRQPHVATAHVGCGALILAVSVILSIQSFRRIQRGHRAAVSTVQSPAFRSEAASR